MKQILMLYMIVAAVLATKAFATEAIDFSNPSISCTSQAVAEQAIAAMQPHLKMKAEESKEPWRRVVEVLYVKNQKEVSRSADRLVCSMDFVFNVPDIPASPLVLVMFNQDGHALARLENPKSVAGVGPTGNTEAPSHFEGEPTEPADARHQ